MDIDLREIQFLRAANSPGDWVPDIGSEIAFAGRSNVGKSSAINAITNRKGMARTSKTPGRTQQIVFFELSPTHRLVDLPGYGFAKVPKAVKHHWMEGASVQLFSTLKKHGVDTAQNRVRRWLSGR